MDKKIPRRKVLWNIISVLLAVLTVYTVMNQSKDMSLGDLMDMIAGSDKRWFACGVVSAALYVWFEAVALRTILKETGYLRTKSSGLVYSAADVYFSAVTPSATGGQPASAYFIIKDGVPAGVATAALILNLIMYTISVVVLGIISICIAPSVFSDFDTLSEALIIAGAVALTLLSVFFIIVLRHGEMVFRNGERLIMFLGKKGIIRNTENRLKKLNKTSGEYSGCTDLITGRPKMLVKVFIWNFLQRSSQIAVPMLMYISVGGSRRKAPLIFAKQCLINIGYNFVPIPGAMGISDYLMLDGFKEIMGPETAYRIELISRGVTFYLCVAICGLITLFGYLRRRNRK